MGGDPIGLKSRLDISAAEARPLSHPTRVYPSWMGEVKQGDALLRGLSLRAGEPEQRIVIHGLDRCKIAMRDVFRPRGLADVIRDRIQREINDLARIRRDVAGRAVHQIAMG